MNKLKIGCLLLAILIATYCTNINKSNISNTSIEILYLKGKVETTKAISCGTLKKGKTAFGIGDTVIQDKHIFNQILNQIIKLKAIKVDSLTSSCDIRMQCKIKLENRDTIQVCIGEFNCIVKDGFLMGNNDTLVYLMRKYSGYYNYFSKEDLAYFNELKQFAVPGNYKDLRREITPRIP